jgi:hypothetical protein
MMELVPLVGVTDDPVVPGPHAVEDGTDEVVEGQGVPGGVHRTGHPPKAGAGLLERDYPGDDQGLVLVTDHVGLVPDTGLSQQRQGVRPPAAGDPLVLVLRPDVVVEPDGVVHGWLGDQIVLHRRAPPPPAGTARTSIWYWYSAVCQAEGR